MIKPKYRQFRRLQYSNHTRSENLRIKHGHQSETTSLNINLHTLNKKYLASVRSKCNEVTRKSIDHYNKQKANFQSTRKLFTTNPNNNQVRSIMINLYSSSQIVKKILTSDSMEFVNKMIFIKFLQKVRRSAVTPSLHTSWKDRIFNGR